MRRYWLLLVVSMLTTSVIGIAETTLESQATDISDKEVAIGETDSTSGALKSPQYSVGTAPVHQWIAFQAYLELPSGPLKNELSSYLPTSESYYTGDAQGDGFVYPDQWENDHSAPYSSTTALIEGTWEEDWSTRPVTHFWNPDSDYDDGLLTANSALETAQNRWDQAVLAYGVSGDKTLAYYFLGRVAHLVMDMSVPAHVQLDQHLLPGDQYESFTKEYEFHYKQITSNSTYAIKPDYNNPPGADYPRPAPGINPKLTNLMYSLANYTDQFDSDDKVGDVSDSPDYGGGKYNRAHNPLDAGKTFLSAYKINYATGNELRQLNTPNDFIVINCSWSSDASIIYTETFYNEKNSNPFWGMKVNYTDGSSKEFYLFRDGVPYAALGEVFQPQLQGRAIGYTAGSV